jgi:hypothetical protein
VKRSGFKPRREPMARGTNPMKRGKRLGPGKKTLARKAAMASAILSYFEQFGWLDDEGYRVAPCQVSGDPMRLEEANAHHKTARSELRKAGVKDLDAPHRLLICHYRRHLRFIHKGEMGRPKELDAARRFEKVELDPANAENGLIVAWTGLDAFELGWVIRGKKSID